MPPAPFSIGSLPDLPISELPAPRSSRYDGGGVSAALADFPADDRKAAQALYDLLLAAHARLEGVVNLEQSGPEQLEKIGAWTEWTKILNTAHQLGHALGTYPPHLQSVVHDLRGGSLLSLVGLLAMLDPGESAAGVVTQLANCTRDQLKIMRNCIPEIDPGRHARDLAHRPHHVDLLREKWSDRQLRFEGARRRIVFESAFNGTISHRCQEFSAVDRVVYNLMNNALRHAADEVVGLGVFIPAGQPAHVRFVVQNRLTAAQRARLDQLTGGKLAQLFAGGLTTDGHGVGLRTVAEFVSRAYGLKATTLALHAGVLGAVRHEDRFIAWFHWPNGDE